MGPWVTEWGTYRLDWRTNFGGVARIVLAMAWCGWFVGEFCLLVVFLLVVLFECICDGVDRLCVLPLVLLMLRVRGDAVCGISMAMVVELWCGIVATTRRCSVMGFGFGRIVCWIKP